MSMSRTEAVFIFTADPCSAKVWPQGVSTLRVRRGQQVDPA